MEFKFNLVHKQVAHQLREGSVFHLPVHPGKARVIVAPDTDEKEESYTLSLHDGESPVQLPSADGLDLDYEFVVQHANAAGKIEQAFMADEPHTRLLNLTGKQLSAKLTVLPPDGAKKYRAYLALSDTNEPVKA